MIRQTLAMIALLSTAPPIPGVEALDWAFKFASAIDADPTDKGRAQQWTVMEYPKLGALDLAVERADTVEGWRRGVVYADLAVELAKNARPDKARELLRKAVLVRAETTGWQGPRIEAHVAQALAALGDASQAGEITTRLAEADARQYLGRAAVTMAVAHGARDGFDAGMKVLHDLDRSEDLEAVWWRTMGFLELARDPDFDEAQRKTALEATKQSAAAIPGWKQAEVLVWLAEEWRERDSAQAKTLLREAEAIMLPTPETLPTRGPMLAEIAAGWAELGERKRTNELLELALASAPQAMVIEQPEIHGQIAAAFMTAGDMARGKQQFDHALKLSGELVNSRPRALALSAILRSMAEVRLELDDATRARLVALYGGLGDPW